LGWKLPLFPSDSVLRSLQRDQRVRKVALGLGKGAAHARHRSESAEHPCCGAPQFIIG
jgi:hypothetical protein